MTASTADWLDLSPDWIVGKNEALTTEAWPLHTHRILINGRELADLAQYTHAAEQYVVDCPQEEIALWAKGLSIYLPPLPAGEYEIRWRSDVNEKFHNGLVEYAAGDYLEARAELTVSAP